MTPSVTVVIPTLNGSRWLPASLRSLRSQNYEGPTEILVIDSSSDDATRAILEREAVPHEVIPREEFQHGRTRNLAASLCRTDLVAFLSQDALPANPFWLGSLVDGLLETGAVGAYARQIAPSDVHPFQALNLNRHMPSDEARERAPRIQPPLDAETWRNLSPITRLSRIRFDNVSSIVRRDFLMGCPFPELDFGEDLTWARTALFRGQSLAFTPAAEVIHAHAVNREEFSHRVRKAHALAARLADFRPISGPAVLLRRWGGTTRRFWRALLADTAHGFFWKTTWALAAPYWAWVQMTAMARGSRESVYDPPQAP